MSFHPDRQKDQEEELDMLNLMRRDCGLSGPGDGRQFIPCPLAGLRAFELANGEAQKQVQAFAALSHEQVLLELEHLSETDTSALLEDFELGRATIAATLANKLQHWKVLPWSLVLLGDPDVQKARQAATTFLEEFDSSEQNSSLHHRLTWHIFTENVSFRAELEAFSRGDDLRSLPQLRRLVWELLFIPVASA